MSLERLRLVFKLSLLSWCRQSFFGHVDLRLQHAYVRQIAVFFVIIKPVAHDESVGNFKTGISCVNGSLAAGGLVHQRCNGDGRRIAVREVILKVAQCHTGVEDVLDHDDVSALDVLAEVLVDLDRTGGGGSPIGGDRHKIDGAGNRHAAHEVRHENEAALQNADEDRIHARKVLRDLCTEGGNLFRYCVLGKEYAFNITSINKIVKMS